MKHTLVQTACVLVGIALGVEAQTANPNLNAIPARDAEVYAATAGNDSQAQQSYLSNPEYKSTALGYISGTILDQTGAVSVGATVHLTPKGQSSDQEVTSGGNGQFLFANVPPGPFLLTVTSPGFATREISADLRPGETFLVPPILLTVEADATKVRVNVPPLSPAELADIQIKEQEKQRVFGFIPNFYVSYDRQALPLNSRQKFRLAWKTMLDPFTVVGVGALAGIEQAANAFDGYGQGAEGYFKRFGASYTDAVAGTFIGSAILPSILKQDPRYFYKGSGSTRSRLLYALASPVICRGDNLRWQPNYSNVAGAFASAGISYLYYPESDRNGAGLVVQNSLIRVGEVAFEGVLQEFVIRRLTPHLRNRASDQR